MTITPRELADDVLYVQTLMVNVFLVRTGSTWVLVDTGLQGYSESIRSAARQLMGTDTPPASIVLTHGHFDHVGSLRALLEDWNAPVYSHRLEAPYLTGRSPYPPPDPLVGGGAMALLSRLYPRGPYDFRSHLELLPDSGTVPGLPEWRWIHTPGHTAGHVSLFRERDRFLIAGDAVTTVRQESLIAVATQRPELHGPPAYFTQDWRSATQSVQRIASLNPEVLASGHGRPLRGGAMRDELRALAARFEQTELPSFGRYRNRPALTDQDGIVSLPPDPLPKVLGAAAVAASMSYLLARQRLRSRGPEGARSR
jgi:glyoxylase-like metal-dependent hydrolase (beta-lactamase superfamily II)